MKRITIILTLVLTLCIFCTACSAKVSDEQYVSKKLGIEISGTESVEQTGEHGGFHGDGEYVVKIKFTKERAQELLEMIQNAEGWNELPLDTVLQQLMYNGTESNTYAYNFAQKAGIPEIEKGYYRFSDRSLTETETSILFRHSFNFTFAVYDSEQGMLYYYELDT